MELELLIQWVLGAYGHLLFFAHEMTGPEFAAEIRATYDCGATGAGPINETAAKIAERRRGTFYHRQGVIGYVQEAMPCSQ